MIQSTMPTEKALPAVVHAQFVAPHHRQLCSCGLHHKPGIDCHDAALGTIGMLETEITRLRRMLIDNNINLPTGRFDNVEESKETETAVLAEAVGT